jgi:predicted ribonuclease YlaK
MKKTYVLDTNVLLSDSNSLFGFEEHDLVLPLIVLEELDRHKDRQEKRLSFLICDACGAKSSIKQL